jgi:hypothetical protein
MSQFVVWYVMCKLMLYELIKKDAMKLFVCLNYRDVHRSLYTRKISTHLKLNCSHFSTFKQFNKLSQDFTVADYISKVN